MKRIVTLIFLIPIYLLNSCVSSNQTPDCEMYKTGRFELHSKINNSITTIDRHDSIQIETNKNNGDVVKAIIRWSGNCEYELSYLSEQSPSQDTIASFIKSTQLKTVILKADKDYYVFKSSIEGSSMTLIDTIWVLH